MLRELARKIDPLLAVHLGRYERGNVATLKSLVRPGMVVWDLGANIGQMAYILSGLVRWKGTVVAVEPGPENVRRLRQNMRRRHNVVVIEKAVSETDGYATFLGDGRSDARLASEGGTLVRTVTLDGLLTLTGLEPRVVKMDIEGHELPAFRGATRVLNEIRPLLVVEFHGAGLPARDIDAEARALVEQAGYTWARSPGGWHVGTPASRHGTPRSAPGS